MDEACSAEKAGSDYVAVGSIYPTSSKSDIKIAGLETLRSVKTTVSIPVVAIGGIQENNVSDVLDAGADAVAVISAIMSSNDIEKSAHRLSLIIKDKNSQ